MNGMLLRLCSRQLRGRSDEEIENYQFEPIDLSMARIKQVSGEWFVEAVEYIGQNLSFLVNGFIKAGITDSIGGNEQTR